MAYSYKWEGSISLAHPFWKEDQTDSLSMAAVISISLVKKICILQHNGTLTSKCSLLDKMKTNHLEALEPTCSTTWRTTGQKRLQTNLP